MEKENATANSQMHDAGVSGECPLDVFTPQALISKLASYKDCTQEMVELIKNVQVNQNKMKKMCRIFCAVSNCSVDAVVDLTRDRSRMLRYISTHLVLSKIGQWVGEEKGFGVVEKMYDEVFLVRFRDVDFSIRAMCVESMCEWVLAAPRIFNNPSYLKYIGWALSDKNDTVRRRAVNACTRLVEKIDAAAFVERFRSRIVELTLFDKNPALREEGRILCMASFLHGLVDRDCLYAVLAPMKERDEKGILETVLAKLLENDGTSLLENHDGVHNLLTNTSLFVCSCIPHEPRDAAAFLDFVVDFLREKSSCCGEGCLCYIRILGVLPDIENVERLCELLEISRDCRANVVETLRCIGNMDAQVFKMRANAATRLLDLLKRLCGSFQTEDVFVLAVQLLKKLEDDFAPSVNAVVEHFKTLGTDSLRCTIKSFDVSDAVDDDSPSDVKCYAVLWRIIAGDYEYVNSCAFHEASRPETLCDFLLFFREKCMDFGALNEQVEEAHNQGSSFKTVFRRLSILLHGFAEHIFVDEQSCVALFKLVDEDLLVEHSHLLFRSCSEDLVSELLGRGRLKANLVDGFFRHALGAEESEELSTMARAVSSKCTSLRKSSNKTVFRNVKMVVDQNRTSLYDSVLVHFVPLLSVNECIVVEQSVQPCRFRMSLIRRSRRASVGLNASTTK